MDYVQVVDFSPEPKTAHIIGKPSIDIKVVIIYLTKPFLIPSILVRNNV